MLDNVFSVAELEELLLVVVVGLFKVADEVDVVVVGRAVFVFDEVVVVGLFTVV